MLRLATYNLESLGERHGAPPLAARIAVLRPRLSALAADILCLQEVDAQPSLKHAPRQLLALHRVLEGTSYEGFHSAASEFEPSRIADRHNLVVLSRLPILQSHSIRHRHVAAPRLEVDRFGPLQAIFDRPLQYCAITLADGRSLHLLNLHLRAPLAAPVADQKSGTGRWQSSAGWATGYQVAAMKRGAQALEARLVVDAILDQDPGGLIAVCGDFNASQSEVPVRLLTADPEDTENRALAGRTLISLAARLPAERRFSVRHHGLPMLVDHILASPALAGLCRGIDIHNQALIDESAAEKLGAAFSDSTHAPIVATFDLD